ncbi:DUF3987 domain-containing protein [Bradyrhizobium sp. CCBAU 051011]|uniref:DUF3987 domain-containing protein n=1 Tax=Bradyrhizobium sp. CCBAU 051011 TaxID=858422 RepID=UPI00137AEF63|nr:DUF3987 domain-containing protein [Bradyrhizobium sp. CCBAU 051011]
MKTQQDNLSTALALASAGIKIFPAGADKRPLLKGWQEAATCDADQINTWWDRSAALPAIPCGQNGLLVVDCDRHGGPDGVEAFKKLAVANGGLPRGLPVVLTPSGGAHLYFKQPNGEALGNGRGTLPQAIDCRGNGGFVIAPGARLPDGRGWKAVEGRVPINKAPPLPRWIEAILRPPQREEAREPNNNETSDERGRAYAVAALKGVETELAAAPAGERNERLYKTAFRLATMAARGWLMESEILEALVRAAEANHYLREHGHRATMKTIESGLRDGLDVPHDDLEDRDDGAAHASSGNGAGQQQQQHEQPRQERKQRQRETGDWNDPDMSILDDRRGELPDLPIDVFPRSMHRWMREAASGAGVTVGHIALPLIGIASGLIGVARRVQATRSWQQPMTCWTCLVGLSGSGKTPSLDVVKRSLSVVERSRQQDNAARQLAHETRIERAKAALKKWKDDVAAAVDAGQPPPVKPAEAADVRPFVVPRLFVSDCTIERLAPLLEARPRGVTYVADELARLFMNLERYSGGSDRAFWLEAWDGNSFVVERLGRPPVMLPHLLVGVVGGFQPDLLARSFAGDSDGIYSRFLYAWPPEAPFREPADDADETDPEIVNAFGRLASLQAGDDDAFAPRSVPLTADARREFAAFAEFAHKERQFLDGREREYWSKSSGHVLRLSGTLCFLEWAWSGGAEPVAIEARHVGRAVHLWKGYLWPHGRAALRLVGLSDKHSHSRAVLRWLHASNKTTVSREEVRREALSRRLDAGEVQALLDLLVRAGWLREVTLKVSGPGRPPRRWEVNPRLFEVPL